MNAAVIERGRSWSSSLPWLTVAAFVLAGCTSTGSVGDLDAGTTGGSGSSTSGTGGTTGGTSTGGTGGLSAGAPCSGNVQCLSNACGVFGTGYCCAAECTAAIDSACNPTACTANSGACSYPAGAACGVQSCSGTMLAGGACDATGACSPTSAACPGNLLCNSAGTACLSGCATTLDCAAGFFCNAGTCAQKVATGACTEDDDCTTGICGVAGRGFCCTDACSTTNSICGASGCDPTGACVYPDATVSCGSTQVCVASTLLGAFLCDGKGACPTPVSTDCSPYACSDTTDPPACLVSCQDTTSCEAGGFCDTPNATCCTLADNGTVNVDSVSGNDDAGCCGVGTNAPCQTLTRAMALIDAARATSVTIAATVDGGGGDWLPAGEVYPIVLGWGVELSAPSVYFFDGAGTNLEIFDVNFYSPGDSTGYASVIGTASSPIGIGMNSSTTIQTNDKSAIAIEANNTLYIANAVVNASYTSATSYFAINVQAGSRLWLGEDRSGAHTGTVQIGNTLGTLSTKGAQGIYCSGSATSPATIQDAILTDQSSVVIQGQFVDIETVDYCDITLTSNPIFGAPPTGRGVGTCGPPINDDYGVHIAGPGTVALSNATIQCINNEAVLLVGDQPDSSPPSISMDNCLVQNAAQGLLVSAGSASITDSTFQYNFIGVEQTEDVLGNSGSIDLSFGGNSVICSSNAQGGATTPGIDVYNTTTAALNAGNVAWDTPGPDYFTCDAAFASCTCNLASCVTTPGSDGMDAVEDATNLGGVITTGNTLSAQFLDAGCS